MTYYVWLGSIGLIAVGLYTFNLHQKIYEKITDKLKKELMKTVMRECQRQANDEKNFEISDNQQSCIVTFQNSGKLEKIILPYDKSLIRKTIGCQVWLVKPDNIRVNITHKQGIPYLIKAQQLDGLYFEIVKGDTITKCDPDSYPFGN